MEVSSTNKDVIKGGDPVAMLAIKSAALLIFIDGFWAREGIRDFSRSNPFLIEYPWKGSEPQPFMSSAIPGFGVEMSRKKYPN